MKLLSNSFLVVRAFRNVGSPTLSFYALVRGEGGQVHEYTKNLTFGAGTSDVVASVAVGKGELLYCEASQTASSIADKTVWCQISISAGDPDKGGAEFIFAEGYLSNLRPIRFPSGRSEDNIPGAGNLRIIQVADPAAGADLNIQPTTRTMWKLLSFKWRLVTSATVATRHVRWQVYDGSLSGGLNYLSITQAASLTYDYQLGMGNVNAQVNTTRIQSATPEIWLTNALYMNVSAQSLQAGDQFSTCELTVMEYLRNT